MHALRMWKAMRAHPICAACDVFAKSHLVICVQVDVRAEAYRIHFVPPDKTALAFPTVRVGEATAEGLTLQNKGASHSMG